jgi:hypothetical protein
MADKKKFEKPEMQVIQLNAKMRMLAGSECAWYCDHCSPNDEGCPGDNEA